METDKLRKIIERKNERLEDHALKTAEELIESIVREQQSIELSKGRIDVYREQLKALQIQQVDTATVLGD